MRTCWPDDPIIDRTSGRVHVIVDLVPDADPDTSWLGEWSADCPYYRTSQPYYHVPSDAVRLPHSDIWRDRRGRITSAPELVGSAWNCPFIMLPDHADKLRYAFADADRMRALDRGDWEFLGVRARVFINGREIGAGSLWGIESDSEDAYFAEVAREVAHDAIAAARAWLDSLA